MKYIFLILTLLLVACDEGGELLLLADKTPFCEVYDLSQNLYTPDVDVYFKIQPIIFDSELLNIEKVGNKLNDKFNEGGFYFKVLDPIYSPPVDSISFLNSFRDNYEPGEIRMLIFPDSTYFYEDPTNKIIGAADNIPEIDNVAKAKPIFFIRRSKVYSTIIAHELGHVFGLKHTFHDNDIRNKGFNCFSGDRIKTTVTPHQQISVYTKNCKVFIPAYLKDIYSKEDIRNMVDNIESYSPENCLLKFVPEQFMRMRKILELNPRLQDCIIETKNK